jgi:penicillin-binding protein 2
VDHNKKPKTHIPLRLNVFFFFVFIVFSVLIFRLVVIQIVQGETWHEVSSQQSTRPVPIAPIRGNILDTNGQVLAKTVPSYSVVFNEDGFTDEEIIDLAHRLAKLFNQKPEDILKAMDAGIDLKGDTVPRKELNRYIPKKVISEVNEAQMAILVENADEYKGIELVLDPLRQYDENQVAVQLVGYIRSYSAAEGTLDKYKDKDDMYLPWETVGIDGVEYMLQDELRGENGYKEMLVDARGRQIREVKEVPPKQGNHVYLTIDKRMQLELKQEVETHLEYLRTEAPPKVRAPYAKTAYVVAIEVDTGRVVSMLSYPSYNTNVWNKPVDEKTYEYIQFYNKNGAIREAPWDAYPAAYKEHLKHPSSLVYMGSTAKPLTVLIGLNEGIITPSDSWKDPGVYEYGRGGDDIGNFEGHNYGTLTPTKAIAKSANTYMARIGNTMALRVDQSVEKYQNYLNQFGLGVKPGSGLPYESDGREEYLAAYEKYGPQSALVQASMGQQQKFTTLQLAQFVATLANGGQRMRPLVVDKIISPTGRLVKEYKPEILNTVDIPAKYFDVVEKGMIEVVRSGTAAYTFQGFPYTVAAKTGTSEQDIFVEREDKPGSWYRDRRVNNSVFVAYAPAENPRLAVAAIIPEGGYGGTGSGVLARKMFEIYDKYYGLDGVPKLNVTPAPATEATPKQP